jgi:hypothetical protein
MVFETFDFPPPGGRACNQIINQGSERIQSMAPKNAAAATASPDDETPSKRGGVKPGAGRKKDPPGLGSGARDIRGNVIPKTSTQSIAALLGARTSASTAPAPASAPAPAPPPPPARTMTCQRSVCASAGCVPARRACARPACQRGVRVSAACVSARRVCRRSVCVLTAGVNFTVHKPRSSLQMLL